MVIDNKTLAPITGLVIGLSCVTSALRADEPNDNSLGKILENIEASARKKVQAEVKNLAEKGFNQVPGLNASLTGFSSDNDGDSYGIKFDYHISQATSKASEYKINGQWNTSGNFEINSDGLIGVNEAENPRNQITANASLLGNLFYFGGNVGLLHDDDFKEGTRRMSIAATDCVERVGAENSRLCDREINALTKRYRDVIGRNFNVRLVANVGIETDQSFSATQVTYGGSVFLGFNSYNKQDKIKYLNILDYPAAMVRGFAGFEGDGFAPSGLNFPTVRFAVDQVDPDDQSPRALIAGDDSNYSRLNIEAAYRSPLFKVGKTPIEQINGDVIYLTASYRYYRELSPSDIVRAAGLVDQRLWTVSLTGLLGGLYVSYSNGELPLDVERDNVVEIGFKTHF